MLPNTKRWKSGRPELCLACASFLTTEAAKCEVCPNGSVKWLSRCWRPGLRLRCVFGELVQSLPGPLLGWLPFSGWNARAGHHVWFHFMQEESSSQSAATGGDGEILFKSTSLFRLSYQCTCILFCLGTSFKYPKVAGQNWATASIEAHVKGWSKGLILKIHERHASVKSYLCLQVFALLEFWKV